MSQMRKDSRTKATVSRRFSLCPNLQDWLVDDLIEAHLCCNHFFVHCSSCGPANLICHYNRLVFTDGACSNNGYPSAAAGIGVAFGSDELSQYAIPVTERIDPAAKRTSQRAELLAALQGVRVMSKMDSLNSDVSISVPGGKKWIVATDSEYVVNGITEWLPKWKNSDWQTATGGPPKNLDLFQRLDNAVRAEEQKQNVAVQFWHIPRQYNGIADSLAKRAASEALPVPVEVHSTVVRV